MAICSVCGNDYDKYFIIQKDNITRIFDSFECAIQAMAPKCSNCKYRIIGHGIEVGDKFYCCAHCSRRAGHQGMKDRST